MISVVTPTYYRNQELQRAIKSVRRQTIDEVEHIIIDGSEEEYAKEVTKQFPETRYIAPSADPGFHKSRELGIRKSDGDFIQFLDDDDRLKPTKLEKSLDTFQKGTGLVYCGIEHGTSGKTELPDPNARGNVFHRALALDLFPAVPSTWMIRRTLLTDLLPFKHQDGADDDGTHIELAKRTKYEFVNEPLVVLGTEDGQSFSRTWEYVEAINSLLDEYSDLYSEAPNWVERGAKEKIHTKRGLMYLRTHFWHPYATREFIQAARYSNQSIFKGLGMALASVFGRPGFIAGEFVLNSARLSWSK